MAIGVPACIRRKSRGGFLKDVSWAGWRGVALVRGGKPTAGVFFLEGEADLVDR